MTLTEKEREYQRKYRLEHLDSYKKSRKAYYLKNRVAIMERAKQQRKEFRLLNPLPVKAPVIKVKKTLGKLTKWGKFEKLTEEQKFISILSKIQRIFVRLEAIENDLGIKQSSQKRIGKRSDAVAITMYKRVDI